MDRVRDRIRLVLAAVGFLVALGWADDAGIFEAAARGDPGDTDKLILVVSAAFAVWLGFRHAERTGGSTGEVSAVEGVALWGAALAWALLPAHGVRFDVVAGVLAVLLTHQLVAAFTARPSPPSVPAGGDMAQIPQAPARDVPPPVHTPLRTGP